ncbi:Gfo/Idh/MocA family protein [Lacipirellula sp.]|uniref:Gfo/Idh/MocA family protein n=1 Tax=Lacipirellula sp. TaxID=2691419 RepID=UPI003D0EDCFB
MTKATNSRRTFLKTASAATAAIVASPAARSAPAPAGPPKRRLHVACIGMRYQGTVIALKAQEYGEIVAICDVDRHVREQARASFGSTPKIYEDYKKMLADGDFDVVTIGTPDHWHTKMLIDSCRAGKDVYCEKPLTLTVDEGKLIRQVVNETKRVVQVGSWQRSDHQFRLAVELVRQGRIGKLERVEVVLGKNDVGGPFDLASPPPYLNWDLWQGQTADVPFQYERSHYNFRWWYAYSGGGMTDWGAHHLDIAQWAIGDNPVGIKGEAVFQNEKNGYDVARDFHVTYDYPNDVTMTVSDTGRNGILFIGSDGRVFVNRGTLAGKPVDDLQRNPLPREQFTLYAHDNVERPPRTGKLDAIINHMGNFFDCIESREQPISDVESQHRSATTCHLGNISMRLGRALHWDGRSETFVNDAEANAWLSREQRSGFEVV